MPYRCRSCRKHFSVRTGTVLAESRLSLQKWLLAIHMLTSARKGIPSTQMARELGITQKSAWFLAQRIRETWLKDRDGNGQKNLNPFIDKDKILQETIRFAIPGTQWIAIGITTEQFELICRGYVQALYEGAPGRLPSAAPYSPRLSRAPAWTHLSMRPRATRMNGLRTPCSASCEPSAPMNSAPGKRLSLTNFGKSSGGSPIGLPPCRRARSGGESW